MSARNGEPPGCSLAEERAASTRTRCGGAATYVPDPARPSNTPWEISNSCARRRPTQW